MFRLNFSKLGLFLISFCSCLSFQQEGFALPVKYTNLDYMPNMKATLEHATTEGNINGLMQLQNSLNGFPNYFNQSAIGQFVNKAAGVIDNVESTVMGTADAVIGSATTIAGAATDKVTGAVSGAIDSATGTVGNWVDQGVDYVGDMFSSEEGGEKAGKGFVAQNKSGSNVVNKINDLNPLERLTTREKDKKICDNLKTIDGVKTCFYIDNEQDPGIMDVGDIHQHVTQAQFNGISNLYADSAAIVNATADFTDVQEDVNEENPTTVSETLTKRAESDLIFNVIGSAYLGLGLSTLELNSLSIYSTINSVKTDGGF